MSVQVPKGYKQTEVGVIPEDWGVTTVGAEFYIQLGKMLDAEKNIGIPKPYLGNRSVQWGRFDLVDIGLIKLNQNDINKYRLNKGDLLVCEGGEVGRSAIWNNQIEECYFQKALHRLRSKKEYSVLLMHYFLRRMTDTGFIMDFVTKTSIAHLPKDKFENIPLASPQNKEQQAIAEALSDADALIESLEQLIAKKRQIKQGAMQELLTGQRRLPGFCGDWDPVTLGQLGKCLRGVSYKGSSDLFDHDNDQSKRLLRSNNVQSSSIDETDIQFVNTNCVSNDQILKNNDILICMANGSKDLVGKSASFNLDDGFEYTFGAFMGCLRVFHDLAESKFVSYLMQTSSYKTQINNLLAGSSINNLTPTSIESLEFLVPSKEEQIAISLIIGEMDKEIESLNARLMQSRKIKQAMMQELLTGHIRLL